MFKILKLPFSSLLYIDKNIYSHPVYIFIWHYKALKPLNTETKRREERQRFFSVPYYFRQDMLSLQLMYFIALDMFYHNIILKWFN